MKNVQAFAPHDSAYRTSWETCPDFQNFLLQPMERKSISFLRKFGIEPSELTFETREFGGIKNLNPEQPVIDGETLLLPCAGLYAGRCGGQTILFMAVPQTAQTKVELAFSLISNAVTGRPYENELINPDIRVVLYNIFLGANPINVNCEPTSKLLQVLLEQLGVYSRCVWWVNSDETMEHRRYHVSLEAFLTESNAWQMIDAHYGLLFAAGFSALAYVLTSWSEQKPFVTCITDKDFYTHDEFDTYNHTMRLLVLPTRSKLYIGLINPVVSDKDHLLAYCSRSVRIRRLALKDFCYSASYDGTAYMPYQYRSKLPV